MVNLALSGVLRVWRSPPSWRARSPMERNPILAAKLARQIAHGTQPDTRRWRRPLRVRRRTKTGSVVPHFQRDTAAFLAKRHAHAAGIGMPDGVRDALLGNQVNGPAHLRRRLRGKLAQ